MQIESLVPYLEECPYPVGLKCIQPEIDGHGFFPAAKGFTDTSPTGGVMLLGQDWGTMKQFDQWRGKPGQSETAFTSRNVRELYLRNLGSLPVWCTNYLLGAREKGGAVGEMDIERGSVQTRYEEYCWEFFKRQIFLQRPRLVIAFGKKNRAVLAAKLNLQPHRYERQSLELSWEGKKHTASIIFVDHPHSLIRHNRKAVERERIIELGKLFA